MFGSASGQRALFPPGRQEARLRDLQRNAVRPPLLGGRMSRKKQTFTQNDVAKAARGALKAGLALQRIELSNDGRILLFIEPCQADVPADQNEWDAVR